MRPNGSPEGWSSRPRQAAFTEERRLPKVVARPVETASLVREERIRLSEDIVPEFRIHHDHSDTDSIGVRPRMHTDKTKTKIRVRRTMNCFVVGG
jgi:hypothetical protein